MTDLRRELAKAKLNAMPEPSESDRDGETDDIPELPEFPDDDSSSASSASSTGTIIPSPSRNLFARPQGAPRGRTLQQIPWTTYFERELFLDARDDASGAPITYHAYLTSPVGKGPLFVMHHGAGSSGLSFAVLSAEIRKRLPNAGILSPDARGHGSTSTAGNGDGGGVDLGLGTLSSDLLAVIRLTRARMAWPAPPPVVLVGHSLGGAVVTEVASRWGAAAADADGGGEGGLLGYAVLDVVEGSAMDALQSMQSYLSGRPGSFASPEAAIEWHVRSRTIRNSVSARTSVPALLVREEGGGDDNESGEGEGESGGEIGAEKNQQQQRAERKPRRPWTWRTDLAATRPFWEGWFVGLSRKFLAARGGKLLLLAGTDRLDTELTIGQMQGKYALQVFPEAGHFIHEDLPEKTAVVLVDFYRRNDRSALVLPPKVSELLAQGKKV